MRVGIVGNNLYGQVFTRAINGTGRACAVAMAPELGESLEPFASEYRLTTYPRLQDMLAAEQLDVVMLGSVTAHHEADALEAIRAGAHVLVDRPLALSLPACDRIIDAAAAARRVVLVAHVLQFWPEYVAVREMIRRGDLGKPLTITASRISGLLNPAWQARLLNPAYGFGGLEAHVHDIEYLIGLLGQPVSVQAHGRQTPDGGWVQVHSLFRFPGGCTAGVEADYGLTHSFPLSMYLRVVGEEGVLLFTFRGALAASEKAHRRLTWFRPGRDPEQVEVQIGDAYVGLMNHFLDCIAQGAQPQFASAPQARLAVETLLAVSQSASGTTT